MPMMRDIALLTLAERLVQVLDHRPQVGSRRQRLLERGQQLRSLGGGPLVPRLAEWPSQPFLLGLSALAKSIALGRQLGPATGVQPTRSRFLEGFLDLEHLREQRRRRLGLVAGAFSGVAAFFHPDEVLHAADRIPQRSIGSVEQGRRLEGPRLLVRAGPVVIVRMIPPRLL